MAGIPPINDHAIRRGDTEELANALQVLRTVTGSVEGRLDDLIAGYGPKCALYRDSAATIGDATEATVSMTVAEVDTHGFADLTNVPTRITIPPGLGGTYDIDAHCEFEANATGYRELKVLKNGTSVLLQRTTTGSSAVSTAMGGSVTAELLEGAYLEAQVYQTSGGDLDLGEPNAADLAPDTLAASTNATGAVTDIDEDPDSPDANWLTATDDTIDMDARVTFPTPSFTPSGSPQYVKVYVRKTSADTTRTQTIRPTGDVSSTRITGGFGDVDDDPDSPDANWAVTTDATKSTALHVSFPTPTYTPEGNVEVKAWVRKSPAGVTEARFRGFIYQNGALVTAVLSKNALTSTSGVLLTGTFAANLVTDWSQVEFLFQGNVGANPDNDSSTDFGAVELNLTTNVNPTVDIELFESASLAETLVTGMEVTSSTGELITTEFDPASITNWANVEVKVSGSADAGEVIDIGAIGLTVRAPGSSTDFPTGLSVRRVGDFRG